MLKLLREFVCLCCFRRPNVNLGGHDLDALIQATIKRLLDYIINWFELDFLFKNGNYCLWGRLEDNETLQHFAELHYHLKYHSNLGKQTVSRFCSELGSVYIAEDNCTSLCWMEGEILSRSPWQGWKHTLNTPLMFPRAGMSTSMASFSSSRVELGFAFIRPSTTRSLTRISRKLTSISLMAKLLAKLL